MCFTDKDNINIKEYSLEEHLEIKCKNNEKYKHLYAAWTTDKDVYTNSLSAIPVNFPHYSRHEASHSLSIINKIEMLLGIERIKSLSPTDTFLILESAFSHDLGMIIPTEILREEWKKTSFKRFLKRIATDGFDEDITKAANYLLEIQDKYTEFNEKNRDWPVEVRDAVILITAEYFRKGHGSRSELWLKQSEKIAASINANKFIPERIMNIVGKVATAHGREFDDVLANLEHIQNGIGVDKIHPRFIACLIRLGDLLDLDNGRFNEVFEKTSPSPESSKVHKKKHRSITHFLVSPERIEVSAICEDDNVYRETRAWFDWLSDELKNLSSKWSDIVPKDFQGGPPSLGDIKLSIKGAEDITEQLNLRFNIDPVRAFELIEGNGIYNDELVFIRELLQNAMDATKIKIWRDIKNKHYDDVGALIGDEFKEKNLSDYDFSFPRELPPNLKDFYPIKINVEYEQSKDNKGENIYKFTIEDKGCGMSLKDLQRIENAGGSWEQDDELQDFIESMPGWLQPTGSFGIGLHSVFLITDEMKIETKSDNEVGYNISFVSRRKNGYITVKKDEKICSIGTKITLRINESRFEVLMKKQSRNYFNNYDYFDPDYKKKRIEEVLREQIKEIVENITIFNISSNLIKDEKQIINSKKIKNINKYGPYVDPDGLKYYIFLDQYNENIIGENVTVNKWSIEIQDNVYETIVNVIVSNNDIGAYSSGVRPPKILFKEIKCNNSLTIDNQELFDIIIDIKKGKAKEILDVSRDELKEDICRKYIKRVEEIMIPGALKYLYKDFDKRDKTHVKSIYNGIGEDISTSAQLLKLRLAFNRFLFKDESFMKEWGNNISICNGANYTFGDLLESKYILEFDNNNITDDMKEKIKEFKVYVGKDKFIENIGRFYGIFRKYTSCNFWQIKNLRGEYNSRTINMLRLKKRKQSITILNTEVFVNCLKNKEEFNERLKMLLNKDIKVRQKLDYVCYDADSDECVLLYKNIICDKNIENLSLYSSLKKNLYVISPFKENCDQLIKFFNYEIEKVIELIKKDHNFDELVDWVSKNATFREENEDYKTRVIETYKALISDYIDLLKEEDNKEDKVNSGIIDTELNKSNKEIEEKLAVKEAATDIEEKKVRKANSRRKIQINNFKLMVIQKEAERKLHLIQKKKKNKF
ncbi:hypothetical protein CDLVIII_3816 [Clostridium sp. DL-VIII]|uniref:HD domain-containing protein n=1 Tax=Clostridium sp. DL-VIII TaxID=641107 RepID=UPI00023AFFDA|nr:ATP-binding protein [Clostridium sp. DL-VIII]EHJ00365.1 hypothetical protein CDLVIII_3816 [Clostridium sp. DL-VIII]